MSGGSKSLFIDGSSLGVEDTSEESESDDESEDVEEEEELDDDDDEGLFVFLEANFGFTSGLLFLSLYFFLPSVFFILVRSILIEFPDMVTHLLRVF